MHGPQDGDGANDPIAEMNVIPFIDICLVLLIIVLVTASFSTKLLGFDDPQTQEATAYIETSEAVTVGVGTDGKCTLAGQAVALKDLRGAVEKLKGAEGFPTFVLRAARKVKAQHVVAVLGQIRSAGEVRVTFDLQH